MWKLDFTSATTRSSWQSSRSIFLPVQAILHSLLLIETLSHTALSTDVSTVSLLLILNRWLSKHGWHTSCWNHLIVMTRLQPGEAQSGDWNVMLFAPTLKQSRLLCLYSLYKKKKKNAALPSYNSHTIQFAHLKCSLQWCIQSYTPASLIPEHFHHLKKERCTPLLSLILSYPSKP